MTDRKKNSASAQTPWQTFETAMRKIVNVPYSAVKAKLDAEKEARARLKTRKAKYAAFRAANK